ncbi:O-antigen polymerase [Pedobacter sp. G11]|uniref:O-antigen polymerase n=1 Tax=Pedobacter sp. G11 TaxID=2482728 RepID=UPI00143CCA23|nr:O-antigen polymerase [Pedobacter sp. G11]
MAYNKIKYYKPNFAFLAPWILLYLFQLLPITHYNRELDPITIQLITLPLAMSLIFLPNRSIQKRFEIRSLKRFKQYKYNLALIVCYALFLVNFAFSGFLPFIRLIISGDSNYFDYGIKGLNGLFYAYANAFGVLSYYIFIHEKRKKYLYVILSIFVIFLLCMTRQNIISLIVEIAILHSICAKPINNFKLATYIIILLIGFGILGESRSGDIREIMGLKPEFYWLPNSFIWIYSYFFFNVLNLDNIVTSGHYALFDLSSLNSLLPSFLRGNPSDDLSSLEVVNFTISSYIQPIFIDFGFWGVLIITLVVVYLTVKAYEIAMKRKNFQAIGIYVVLFFCASFSFFINFWFYLPIIFQIPFILLLNKFIIKNE